MEETSFAGLKPAEDAEESCLQMISCSGHLIHWLAGSLLSEGLHHIMLQTHPQLHPN